MRSFWHGRTIETAALEKREHLPDGVVVVHDERVVRVDRHEVGHPGQAGLLHLHRAVMRTWTANERRIVRRGLEWMKAAGSGDDPELTWHRTQLLIEIRRA